MALSFGNDVCPVNELTGYVTLSQKQLTKHEKDRERQLLTRARASVMAVSRYKVRDWPETHREQTGRVVYVHGCGWYVETNLRRIGDP